MLAHDEALVPPEPRPSVPQHQDWSGTLPNVMDVQIRKGRGEVIELLGALEGHVGSCSDAVHAADSRWRANDRSSAEQRTERGMTVGCAVGECG